MTAFTGLNDTEITDFAGLRKLGDEKIMSLIAALNGTESPSHSLGSSVSVSIPLLVLALSTTLLCI